MQCQISIKIQLKSIQFKYNYEVLFYTTLHSTKFTVNKKSSTFTEHSLQDNNYNKALLDTS